MKFWQTFLGILMLTLCGACQHGLSGTYEQVGAKPVLFPDYTDITIPYNIAPLNFIMDSADRVSIIILGDNEYRFSFSSGRVTFPLKKWKAILKAEMGNRLEVYVKTREGRQSRAYRPFIWHVAQEPIDAYMSYRRIEPAYEVWNKLQICERDVTTFKERTLADNNITDNTCINCHTSNKAPRPATFMHVRGKKGGTVYAKDGQLKKVNTATNRTSGAAVYGELDQSGRYGIFTTATIIPILHSFRTQRLEVYDTQSDLILLDFERGTVSDTPCITGSAFQETFPCFSADNRTIYFCRANSLPQPDSTFHMRYNLYSIGFDPATGTLADSVTCVLDLAALGKSAAFPKCSPDGKFLLFCASDYGTFPIWHAETDLWMLNLATGELNTLERTNGLYADSYHSWSSNGRWIAFASKRGDRVYGRPYLAYVNASGDTEKAFVLPLKDPNAYRTTLQSYNIPELYPTRETYSAGRIRTNYFRQDVEAFVYKPAVNE